MRRHETTLALLVLLCAARGATAQRLIFGTDQGVFAHVKAFDANTLAEQASFFAYGPSFSGGVRVAVGDVNGDTVQDIITGAGTMGQGHVKVFSGTNGAELASFLAFPGFTGGVSVGSGDFNSDVNSDIIVGVDEGAQGGHVKVFSGASGAEIRSFFAFPGFLGGVRVAGGDINGDGFDDIIVGAGTGGNGHVKVFDGVSNLEIQSFLSYPGFTGGVFVAAGDLDGDGRDEIITGADEGAPGGHVKVFDGLSVAQLDSFFAYPGFQGGVRVGAVDRNGDGRADIITGTGSGAIGHVKVFSGATGAEILSFFPYGDSYRLGVFVAGETLVPEPTSAALALGGVALLAVRRQRRR